MSESNQRPEKRPRIKATPKHEAVFSTDRVKEKVSSFFMSKIMKTKTAFGS